MSARNKFYLTTAIPYVNAPPHLGHALEFVQADVLARYHGLLGDRVFLLSGADENALKNVLAAQDQGLSVQELVDRNSDLFRKFMDKMNINLDGFERGSDKKLHWPGVREVWRRCYKNGDIYKKYYRGLYCVGHEAFITEKELVRGECPDHRLKPEIVEEENYFFKLSKYQQELEKLIENNVLKITPISRKNEVLKFIRSGLEDLSISRSQNRARGWGIPVPGDDSQVIYVWFDALSIYLTGVGFGTNENNFKTWWPTDVHIIGKDIIRFHAVYWPAILFSAGLLLPKEIFVHGFITSAGQKMSKSVGNVVDPIEIVKTYGADALRYYLLREIPATEDGDFTTEKFIARYNGDLANGLGNLTARVLTLAHNSQPHIGSPAELAGADERLNKVWAEYEHSLHDYQFHQALEIVWSFIHFLDEYIDRHKPWQTKDEKIIYKLLVGLANIGWLIDPFMPNSADKIFEGLGVKKEDTQTRWKFKVKKIPPLFPKA